MFKALGELGNGRTCKVTKKLSHVEEEMIWKIRHGLLSKPNYLPAFSLATSWNISESVNAAYRMLGQWTLPKASHQDDLASHILGLQLLQGCIPDPKVRSFAVAKLFQDLSEWNIHGVLMPMLVAINYERFFDSALIRLLSRHAISAPYSIGVILYCTSAVRPPIARV